MPIHRGLSLKKFVKAIPWDLFERYFDQLQVDPKPSGWAFINAGAMEAFLIDPENAEASGAILGDFRRVNDICTQGMGLVVRAHDRFGLSFRQDAPGQEMAMRLFLDHRDAFEFAWSRYLLYGPSSKLSLHILGTGPIDIGDFEAQRIADELREWFGSQAKGTCKVRHYKDGDEIVILISRGSYMRTVTNWQGDEVTLTTFRPASEDVLLYAPITSQLTIKAGLSKDRQQYLRVFARCIAGDETLADQALERQVFSLAPLEEERFDFSGDGIITEIELTKVRMKLHGAEDAEIEIKSSDVLGTIARQLEGISLASGELTLARFRFHLEPSGEKPTRVTFEVEPPARTDLPKRYADIIERYLIREGVRLQ
jgi:hypothetical protein